MSSNNMVKVLTDHFKVWISPKVLDIFSKMADSKKYKELRDPFCGINNLSAKNEINRCRELKTEILLRQAEEHATFAEFPKSLEKIEEALCELVLLHLKIHILEIEARRRIAEGKPVSF